MCTAEQDTMIFHPLGASCLALNLVNPRGKIFKMKKFLTKDDNMCGISAVPRLKNVQPPFWKAGVQPAECEFLICDSNRNFHGQRVRF